MSDDYLKTFLLRAKKCLIGKRIVAVKRVNKNDLETEGLNEMY